MAREEMFKRVESARIFSLSSGNIFASLVLE